MLKENKYLHSYIVFINHMCFCSKNSFDSWVKDFKSKAVNSGISEIVVEDFMDGVKFLPKVIEYDRFQPEFYEDTATYIGKRASIKN